jgi:hypothetical protein
MLRTSFPVDRRSQGPAPEVTRHHHGAIISADKNDDIVDQGESAMPGNASWITTAGNGPRYDQ